MMTIRVALNVHGATWEQYDAVPGAQQESTEGFRCRWKWLKFGRVNSDITIAIHEPDEPRPAATTEVKTLTCATCGQSQHEHYPLVDEQGIIIDVCEPGQSARRWRPTTRGRTPTPDDP